MKRFKILQVVVGVALVLATSACTPPQAPQFDPTNGPAIGDQPQSSATPGASGGASEVVPTEPEPDPSSAAGAEEAAPPSQWSDGELLGACKEAVIKTGALASWDDYSSEPSIAANGEKWTVTLASQTGGRDLVCSITGTPADPSVSVS